jgi:hypothetical protein
VHVRHVRPLCASRLASLDAQRLGAYRRKLLAVQESADLSDLSAAELARLDPKLIHFKEDPRWRELHDLVTTVRRGADGVHPRARG